MKRAAIWMRLMRIRSLVVILMMSASSLLALASTPNDNPFEVDCLPSDIELERHFGSVPQPPGHDAIVAQVQNITLNLTLSQGWNLVTIPVTMPNFKASYLRINISDAIVRWNSTRQIFDKMWIVGISVPWMDFVIMPDSGYWIFIARGPETISFTGLAPQPVQATAMIVPEGGGWVTVGLNSLRSVGNASDLASMYSGEMTMVVKWNPITKFYTTHIVGTPWNDFSLIPGEGYWIWCRSSGTLTYQA